MNYQDFDLLIDRAGENLRAQVINSPAGQATAEFRLPFSEDKLENFLLRLGGRTRRGTTRRVETQEMTAAKAFGAALFTAVFSGDVKACFRSSFDEARRQNAGLRIRLRLADPSVVDLPWEYLYNPAVNRFLALSIHTPLVRYMDLPERIQPISVTPPIRVLVMISSPTDFPTLDVEAEWTRLNEALADLIGRNQIAIERLDDATLEALQRRLRRERYHIFHFIGHGEFDENSQEGVLILEGGQGARPPCQQPVARHDAARSRIAARGDPERLRRRAHVAHRSVRRVGAEPRPAGHPGGDRHAVRDRRRRGEPVRARVLRRARGRVSDRRLAHRSPQVDLCRAARSRMGHAGALHARARRPHLRRRYRRPAEAAERRRERPAGHRIVDSPHSGADHRRIW